jgi:hypothetical protein
VRVRAPTLRRSNVGSGRASSRSLRAAPAKPIIGRRPQLVCLYLDAIEPALESIDRSLDRLELMIGRLIAGCFSLEGQPSSVLLDLLCYGAQLRHTPSPCPVLVVYGTNGERMQVPWLVVSHWRRAHGEGRCAQFVSPAASLGQTDVRSYSHHSEPSRLGRDPNSLASYQQTVLAEMEDGFDEDAISRLFWWWHYDIPRLAAQLQGGGKPELRIEHRRHNQQRKSRRHVGAKWHSSWSGLTATGSTGFVSKAALVGQATNFCSCVMSEKPCGSSRPTPNPSV